MYVRQVMIRTIVMTLLVAGTVWTAEPNPTETGIAEFTRAYQAWDGTGFVKAVTTFAQAPDTSANQYWRGTAEFHRLLFLVGEPATKTNRLALATALESTLMSLQSAVQHDPSRGETHALLSTAYGLSIGANPARGLWLGKRVMDEEKLARQLNPDNPRVLYLAGMNRYYGPALLGGMREGLQLLLAAEKLFETEAATPGGRVEPRWGRSTCLVYIGKTYAALGKPAEAEQYFRKALVVSPQDKLARIELEKPKK